MIVHDCDVGKRHHFGTGETWVGDVTVEDYVMVSDIFGVDQFCRVGRDVLSARFGDHEGCAAIREDRRQPRAHPRPATIGLARGRSVRLIAELRRAYRHLLHSNTSRALAQIEHDPALKCDEVQDLIDFIRSSSRGVGLRRPSRRLEEVADD